MPAPEVRDFEIITPKLSEMNSDELRMPNLGEVILTHGVEIEDDRQTKIGNLVLSGQSGPFIEPFTPWHYDMIHTQGHLTDMGRLLGKFVGIKGEFLSPSQIQSLSDELDKKAIEVELKLGDLLVMGGFRTGLPIVHTFQAKVVPRCSRFIPIQIR